MWDDITREDLMQYEEIVCLSTKEINQVSLVLNKNRNHMAVRKIMKRNLGEVYHKLKDIHHINLPQVYYIIDFEDHMVVLEEYLEGLTLQDILYGKEVIEEKSLINIIRQLCNALQVLHELPHPIIHRDIKPSNIILNQDNTLKLIDFDASREYKAEAIKDTIILGTLEYAPPEQYGFSQTDNRSDIYGMGMLIADFLRKAIASNKQYEHQVELKKIMDRCTMFDPNLRYQSVRELKRAVSRVGRGNNTIYFMKYWISLILYILVVIFSILKF